MRMLVLLCEEAILNFMVLIIIALLLSTKRSYKGLFRSHSEFETIQERKQGRLGEVPCRPIPLWLENPSMVVSLW